jgi:hypothetical protein
MKLSKEIKEKIDYYFDNILAEKLIEIAVCKYGFIESNIELENQSFITIRKSHYSTKNSSFTITEKLEDDTFPFAA